ncbi:hypothetical protein [Arsenicicoccus bolidensis]|uniref:hypothetical protein n=1 Tax=Arsenicicoccus bolidensis TaxID=229480 RepID=UPI0003FA42AA|nr:hypothetical protein [Arsenicicoccus bolidensis]
MATRRSLRDRNRAAIAHDPGATNTDPPTPPRDSLPAADESKLATAGARKEPPAAKSPATRAAAAGETVRLGIYLTPDEFNQAKAGYLADWTNGGQADSFARWIAAAISAYAAKTPEQRAEHATPKGRAQERTGAARSFSIPTATVERMRAAITADRQAGRWPSDSAWCGEALQEAVAAALSRNGGTLPTPPPRLPNRLVR